MYIILPESVLRFQKNKKIYVGLYVTNKNKIKNKERGGISPLTLMAGDKNDCSV